MFISLFEGVKVYNQTGWGPWPDLPYKSAYCGMRGIASHLFSYAEAKKMKLLTRHIQRLTKHFDDRT